MPHSFQFTQRKWFKNVKLLVLTLIMVSGCLFLVLTQDDSLRRPLPFVHFIGWLGLLFFGGAFLLFVYLQIKYMCLGRPFVMFTDEGLLCRDILVPWVHITGIYGAKNCVVIQTDGKEDTLASLSPFKRWMMRWNERLCGGKYTISDFDYDGPQDAFCEKIVKARERAVGV